MFDDSDFELDDEAVNAVFDKLSTNNLPNSTSQKRLNDETKAQEVEKKMRADSISPKNKLDKLDVFLEDVDDHNEDKESTTPVTKRTYNLNQSTPLKTPMHDQNTSLPAKASLKKIVQRKFPGPAGLLPERTNKDVSAKEDECLKGSQCTDEALIMSQFFDVIFESPPWQKMLEEFSQGQIDEKILPHKYNIEWIKNKATARKLINKRAPFLAGIIQTIDCPNIKTSISISLKDPTGEIPGIIDDDLCEEYPDLQVGSVVILKQVGVLTTGLNHVLNITDKNLVKMYSPCALESYDMKNKSLIHVCNSSTVATEASNCDSSFANPPITPHKDPKIDCSSKVKIITVQNLTVQDIINDIKKRRSYHKRSNHSSEDFSAFLDNFNRNFSEKASNLQCTSTPSSLIKHSQQTVNTDFRKVLHSTCSIQAENRNTLVSSSVGNTLVNSSVRKSTNISNNLGGNDGTINSKKFKFRTITNSSSKSVTPHTTNDVIGTIFSDNTGSVTSSKSDDVDFTKEVNTIKSTTPDITEKVTSNKENCSNISVKTGDVEETKLVENIFEGVDTSLFFDEF